MDYIFLWRRNGDPMFFVYMFPVILIAGIIADWLEGREQKKEK